MSDKVKAEVEHVAEYVRGDDAIRMFTSLKTKMGRYVGMAMVTQSMHTPQGVQQRDIPVTFDIVATSIEEAFKNYCESRDHKLKELQTQANVPRIIKAN